MNRDQKTVAVGAVSGVLAMALAMWLLSNALPVPAGGEEVGNRIAYALKWNAFAALPLLAMIAAVGNARFAGEAIDPTRGAENPKMIIDGRVTENTLQQFALFFAGSLALAVSLPPDRLPIVGAAARHLHASMRVAF